MLLAFASAPDKLFLLELTFDAALPGIALLADEFASMTLEVLQMISVKFQVPFCPASLAGIRLDVSGAEATVCACKAYCLSFVLLRITHHVFVELLLRLYLVARVAAPRRFVALALGAVFRVGLEYFGDLFHTARGAGMAGSTS